MMAPKRSKKQAKDGTKKARTSKEHVESSVNLQESSVDVDALADAVTNKVLNNLRLSGVFPMPAQNFESTVTSETLQTRPSVSAGNTPSTTDYQQNAPPVNQPASVSVNAMTFVNEQNRPIVSADSSAK